MTIEKIGELYTVKGRFNSRLFTAVAQTVKEAINSIFSDIAIIRSSEAWNK